MTISISKQSKAFIKNITFSEKAQETSYLVAELIVQKMKGHTGGENKKCQHVKL
jgi:hypothetical protein